MAIIKCFFTVLVLSSFHAGCAANQPPELTATMDLHVISEDTPVGASVYRLGATDPEGGPVRYRLGGSGALRVDPDTGVVVVAEPLDRETQDSLRLTVTVEDSVDNGENNIVTLPITIIVIDANDNPPQFSQPQYVTTVDEDAPTGATVLTDIHVTDLDQVGQALQIRCVPKIANQDPCPLFRVEVATQSPTRFSGALILAGPLSFARQREYAFLLQATDGELVSTADVTIRVADVQNRPPQFHGSRTGVVREDVAIGTVVMTVRAKDDDVGRPRRVMYRLLENPKEFFQIDPSSGELRTARPLDREALAAGDGVVRLMVQAYEVNADDTEAKEEDSTTEAMITVTIRDVNDEAPSFDRGEYRTTVPENVPDDTPLAQLDMVVRDTDVGSNAVFALSIVDSSGKFSVEPSSVSGSSSVSLRVAKGPLDFENPNEQKFILLVVAQETLTEEKLSSTATVVVTVTDVNDNAPQFDQDAYSASIIETAGPGTVVASISATDRDTGILGTQGIKYMLSGNGAEKFSVDPESGVITVVGCPEPEAPTCLDYETRNTYFLSLQASDNKGVDGKSRVVPVRVSLLDANDNPPSFARNLYTSAIEEKAPDFDPPLVVKAVDPDDISRINYSIVGGDPNKLFVINPSTGRITLSNPTTGLDISDLPSDKVTLTIEASDGVGSSVTKVEITVRDANNHSPQFSQLSYLAAVQETSAIGSTVAQVSAVDGDVGENAVVKYRIQKGAFQDFSLDPNTGVLTVAKHLDFDTRDSYTIEVLGADGGRPQRVSTATVTLSVVNNNDKSPMLTPHTQRTQVREDAAPGQRVTKIIAVDPDVSSLEGLRYQISTVLAAVDSNGRPLEETLLPSVQNMFSINELTGEVFVSGPVNRDVVTEVTLGITVSDVSADAPQQGHGALVITLLDVNDFPPMFPPPWSPDSPEIRLTVPEELPLDSVVTSLEATDADSNIGGYNLIWEPPLGVDMGGRESPLTIDGASGVVSVAGRLDFEEMEELVYKAVVWDTGLPQLTSTATFIVLFENLNDETPAFEKESYTANVAEHAEVGTSVTQVRAVDGDKGELGRVVYSLTGSGSSLFSVSSEGEVRVAAGAVLDRETQEAVTLRVVATDEGLAPRQTSVPLVVNITDTNDHSPVFSQRSYRAAVVENLPLFPPAPILQLTALDADAGPNAEIAYTIVGGDDNNHFRLDPSSGILYPAKPLRRQQGPASSSIQDSYSLTVLATDRNGTGRSSGEANVIVELLPQNQHKPRYLSPARPNQTIFVTENGADSIEILQVAASDDDVGENGLVRYHLRQGDANVQQTEHFAIDDRNGRLVTRHSLDRELVSKYEIVLVAKDQGSPISYETLRVLTVVVDDEDDHLPEFVNAGTTESNGALYAFSVVENSPTDTKIGRVTAVDLDADTNAQVYYHLLNRSDDASFHVDKIHGYIYTSTSLDREKESDYTLLIVATNSPTLSDTVAKAALNALTLKSQEPGNMYHQKSLAKVTITVTDENDSPPIFSKEEFYAGISAESEVDRLVRMVSARDPDAGVNGTLKYTITAANLYKPGESKSIGALVPGPFRIDPGGRLVTAVLMTQYKRHRFRLDIQAKEVAPPNRVAKASVHVWVWDGDELVRVVLSQPPRSVVAQQEAIADTLSGVAEGTAVVDEVRYHVRPDNTVNTNWTDMLVHVVNSSGHVLSIDKVLSQMDTGYDSLTAPHHNFSIHNVYPAHLPPPPEAVDARLAGLIALLLVLFIGFISFSVVCCCLRYWVMTPSAKSQENLLKRGIEDDIGLNKTENPLWLDQKLKRYEEQELSMHVMSEFDTTAPPGGVIPGPEPVDFNPHGVSLDAEWNPDRPHIDHMHADGQSNTYATIQKSHGGTIRSMQLRNLAAEDPAGLGRDPYDYYATLEHLRRGDMGERAPNGQPQGPKVPGVQTPHTDFSHVMEGMEFTGSTFQPPSPSPGGSGIANRPLPDEPTEEGRGDGPLHTTDRGEPILVAELI